MQWWLAIHTNAAAAARVPVVAEPGSRARANPGGAQTLAHAMLAARNTLRRTACPSGIRCGIECCQSWEGCHGGYCCPASRVCGAQCCPDGTTCIGGSCCPVNQAGGGQCCGVGQSWTTSGCCNREFVCGTTCCTQGECGERARAGGRGRARSLVALRCVWACSGPSGVRGRRTLAAPADHGTRNAASRTDPITQQCCARGAPGLGARGLTTCLRCPCRPAAGGNVHRGCSAVTKAIHLAHVAHASHPVILTLLP